MPQVTIAIEEEMLAAYQRYAEGLGQTLEEAIRDVLARAAPCGPDNWLEECFRIMDDAGADSKGQRWRRGELYAA